MCAQNFNFFLSGGFAVIVFCIFGIKFSDMLKLGLSNPFSCYDATGFLHFTYANEILHKMFS